MFFEEMDILLLTAMWPGERWDGGGVWTLADLWFSSYQATLPCSSRVPTMNALLLVYLLDKYCMCSDVCCFIPLVVSLCVLYFTVPEERPLISLSTAPDICGWNDNENLFNLKPSSLCVDVKKSLIQWKKMRQVSSFFHNWDCLISTGKWVSPLMNATQWHDSQLLRGQSVKESLVSAWYMCRCIRHITIWLNLKFVRQMLWLTFRINGTSSRSYSKGYARWS